MWLKSIYIFKMAEPFSMSAEAFGQALSERPCPPCGKQTAMTQGFVEPVEGYASMVVAHDQFLYLMHKEVSRLLPASVLAEEARSRIAKIERKESRKIGRKERSEIKDQVLFDLLPRAFLQTKVTDVVIDTASDQIWVAAGSLNHAESVVAEMRSVLGSLALERASPQRPPPTEMSGWIDQPNSLPGEFEIGDACKLKAADGSKSQISLSAMDLGKEQVKAHLIDGMQVARLSLSYQDALLLELDENLDIRKIRPLDTIGDEMMAREPDDQVSEAQTVLSVEGGYLRAIISELHDHFGVNAA